LELDVNAASAEASVATIAEPLKNNHTLSELKLVQTDGVNVQGLNTILHILPSSTSITRLDLSRMSLSLQSCTLLGNVLRSNTSITSLDLGDNNLDENRISALIDGLEHNTHLTKLNLQGCISGRENLTLICDFLVETSIITEISLSRCGVTSDTASEIARVLQFNSSVTNLNLFNNKLKTAGAKTICEALALNTSLTFLDVGLCDLSSESNEEETTGIFHFAEVIEQNQTLKALHLYRNSMRHADAAALASALEKSTSLGELIFPLNDNVLDLAAVSGCLMVNSSLTKIRFFDNFTQEGFVSLATALQMNQTVTDLDFVGCNIPQDGAIAFAETLRTSKSLKLLGFNDVVVTNPGLTAIFEALQVNSSLTRLWAKSIRCNISQSKNCCNALVGIFAKNTSIQYMEIGANQFGGALRAVQVAEALQQNSTLTDLQFSNLSIADDGAIAFAKLLSEKSILKNLGLAFNLIGRRGINSLVQALRTNTSLTRFWISSGAFSVFDLDFLFGDENLGHKRCNVEVMTEQARVD
jgi:Ran GTPase-activating protein (RanGAP) involved in mRNA processing and transport